VSLIGWSAGGLYAREIARRRPDLVRRVITLGSPIRPQGGEVAGTERWIRTVDRLRSALGDPGFSPSLEAPRVPTTAIHSKSDAVVPWRSALEMDGPYTENVEVAEGHLALAASVPVLRILARRLAMPTTDHPDHPDRDAAA
jgi:pimeloyl-ACP methyl ester carboxylesterase